MNKWIKTILVVFSVMILALSLAACNGGGSPADTTPSATPDSAATPSVTPDTAPTEDSVATLIADFSNGSPEPNQKEIPWKYEGQCDIGTLATSLSAATGLDFFADGRVEDDKAYVVWWDSSTLVSGLDDREQNEDFFFYDAVSLNWFMMDSMAATIKRNLPEVTEVYYSGENGAPVVFPNPEDMAEQGLWELPVDLIYEGSAFFLAHAGGKGDVEGYDDWGDGGDNGDGLAYWNGFDFGPNLSYSEEYESQGDPGDYLNAAEAAKLTFNNAKDTGYIPGYSDSVEYTMTLVDIADIDGDEFYVYRCDVDDALAVVFAYAYKIGDIYMQIEGGEWVPIIWGDGYDDYDDSGDGVDTINIAGGDYAETYYRSQN
jgi:hypothetical protein